MLTRYYGWYAKQPRGARRKATADIAVAPIDGAIPVAEPEPLPLRETGDRFHYRIVRNPG